jgi:GT2 family glycosyltransferase
VISVSLVILTWNRWRSVDQSLSMNLLNANYPIHEIIHVDNGSEFGFAERFKNKFLPSVQVAHRRNLGVSTGYNRGLLLATGSHIVITGCDRVMPKNWLRTWVDHFETIPHTGVISCYTEEHPERTRAPEMHFTLNGKDIRRAIPVEARMHSRDFLLQTGFFREDFDTYGFEDSEWSDRAERVAFETGLINYVIPSMGYATHLLDDDFPRHTLPSNMTYSDYKKSVHPNPRNAALFKLCHARGSPYYNPYSRFEPNWLPELTEGGAT